MVHLHPGTDSSVPAGALVLGTCHALGRSGCLKRDIDGWPLASCLHMEVCRMPGQGAHTCASICILPLESCLQAAPGRLQLLRAMGSRLHGLCAAGMLLKAGEPS